MSATNDSFYDIPSVPQTKRPLGTDLNDTLGDRFFEMQIAGSSPTPMSLRQMQSSQPEPVPMNYYEEKENHQSQPAEPAELPRRSRKDSVHKAEDSKVPQRRSGVNSATNPKPAHLPRRSASVDRDVPLSQRNSTSKPAEAVLPRRSASSSRLPTPATTNKPNGRPATPSQLSKPASTANGAAQKTVRRSRDPLPTPAVRSNLINLPRAATTQIVAARAQNVAKVQPKTTPAPMTRRSASIGKKSEAKPAVQRRSAMGTATTNGTTPKPAPIRPSTVTRPTPTRPATSANPATVRRVTTPAQVNKPAVTRPASTLRPVTRPAINGRPATPSGRLATAPTGPAANPSAVPGTPVRRSEAFWERLSKPKFVTAKIATPQAVKPFVATKIGAGTPVKPINGKAPISRAGVAGVPAPRIARSLSRQRKEEEKK